MAYAATTEFDVRSTGSNANGGGFDTASGGTDRSQSDTPFLTFTDLVIGGTNTTATSAAHPFDPTMRGNIMNVTGGTGFTVQRAQIVSVAGAVATFDRALGTAASTGGTGNLGGGLLTLAAAAALPVAGNTIHVKAGTYTLTASVVVAGVEHSWIGYQTTHGDNGTKPLVTTATNSTPLFDFQSAASIVLFRNFSLSNTATTRDTGIASNNAYPSVEVSQCVFDGFTYCMGGGGFPFANQSAFACEFKNFSQSGVHIQGFRAVVVGCWFHGVTGTGTGVNSAGYTSVDRCIFSNLLQGFAGVDGTTNLITNCTFYKCSSNAISTPTELSATNNIMYQNQIGIGGSKGIQAFNAFGANSLNNRNGVAKYSQNDIILTADPFTNAGGNDFSLNNAAGGGALCKGAGFPGVFPGGINTSVLDLGAVQSAGAGPAGASVGGALGERSGFQFAVNREL